MNWIFSEKYSWLSQTLSVSLISFHSRTLVLYKTVHRVRQLPPFLRYILILLITVSRVEADSACTLNEDLRVLVKGVLSTTCRRYRTWGLWRNLGYRNFIIPYLTWRVYGLFRVTWTWFNVHGLCSLRCNEFVLINLIFSFLFLIFDWRPKC